MELRRIPFDSLCLAAVVREMQPLVGGRVQDIRQPSDTDLWMAIYAQGAEYGVRGSIDPNAFRIHLSTRKSPNPPSPPAFCAALRARIVGAQVTSIRQRGFDRVVDFDFESPSGRHRLIAELMGKHSNLILVDGGGRIVSAIKFVTDAQSARPIIGGQIYAPPPFPPTAPLIDAKPGAVLKGHEGASPFLLRWIEAHEPNGLERVQTAVRTGAFTPVLSEGYGAYPLRVEALGYPERARPSYSEALESAAGAYLATQRFQTERGALEKVLRRVELARETALHDLEELLAQGDRAAALQMRAELILASGDPRRTGLETLEVTDYHGNPTVIALDPDQSLLENAQRTFEQAKRAKARLPMAHSQKERLAEDLGFVRATLQKLAEAVRVEELEPIRALAEQRKWQRTKENEGSVAKADRQYAGYRVRELLAPNGATILLGENAESNDFLTMRVAKPNDWWLHVRGHTSAHVVVRTDNHPERTDRATLEYAAKMAVANSSVKHSSHVPVDYTLKKHVRKPRGAPKGTAVYSQEKTLHVDGIG